MTTDPAARSRRDVLGLLAATPVAAALAFPEPARAQAGSAEGADTAGAVPKDLRPGGAFDRHIAEQAARGRFTGTVLLAHRGRAVLSRSHGLANARPEIANGPDTIFALASVGKMITAVAAVQLAQQGALRLYDKLGAYVDGFPAQAADHVTVHQLITHRSGLGEYRHTDAYHRESPTWTSAEEVMAGITAIIRQLPPAFVPDARTAYSNSGYHLLGEVVARASGMPYHDYVRRHVFAPAGMATADFYTKAQWRDDPRIAHPFTVTPTGERVDVVEQKNVIGTPAGNSFASAPDMVAFMRALVGERLLDRAHTALALSGKWASRWTDSRDVPAMDVFGGYGPNNAIVNNHRVLFHNGGIVGQSTFVEHYPDLDLTTVVLGNSDAPGTSPIVHFAREVITAEPPRR